jgi:hypothetical protein
MRDYILDKAYEMMGLKNEEQYIPVLQEIYGTTYKTADKYSIFDFLGETFCGELKSRDLSINEYPETMIGYIKIEEGFKKLNWFKDIMPNYKVYLWFAFREGLFCWELNDNNYKLNGGDTQKRISGTCNRGWNDFKEHYHIKKEFLTKISDIPVYIHPVVAENTIKLAEKKKSYYKSSLPTGVCLLKIK